MLDNARLPRSPEVCRLIVEPSHVTSVPLDSICEAENYWDLEGKLVLPAFADLHTHLDKTYSPIDNPEGVWKELSVLSVTTKPRGRPKS